MLALQRLFWLENKITEKQFKIAETIYIPFQMVHFSPYSYCVQQFSAISLQRKITEISYIAGKNNLRLLIIL
jgi:hypothetical protein